MVDFFSFKIPGVTLQLVSTYPWYAEASFNVLPGVL